MNSEANKFKIIQSKLLEYFENEANDDNILIYFNEISN